MLGWSLFGLWFLVYGWGWSGFFYGVSDIRPQHPTTNLQLPTSIRYLCLMNLSPTAKQQWKAGMVVTAITAVILLVLSWRMGRVDAFLLLNHDLGKTADLFFRYATNLGDGIVWVPVVILTFIYRRYATWMVIGAIVISTLIAQSSKHIFFSQTQRPAAVIQDVSQLHTVAGVTVHSSNSFPSGHTTTAFTIMLLACLLIRGRWVLPLGFILALTAAYSRVYLAQHFPLDLAGGMMAAMITTWLCSLLPGMGQKNREA